MDDDEIPPPRRSRRGRWGNRTEDQEADEWNSWLTEESDDPSPPPEGLPAGRNRLSARFPGIGRPSFVRPYSDPDPADVGDAESRGVPPPSGRWYGAAVQPAADDEDSARRRGPRFYLLVVLTAGVVAAAAFGGWWYISSGSNGDGQTDLATGIGYPVPDGWHTELLPPVTGFTTAVRSGGAVLMIGPTSAIPDGTKPDKMAVELTDLYSGLLLHGDKVDVVEDRPFNVAGFTGHSRSVLAKYRDVVNRPAFMRVLVLTGTERDAVVVALSQPDEPGLRTDIDDIMSGLSLDP
ncbi:hypothetical protein [Sinosporangium siamense]|uniref:Uncharacterized protein n=1 Tax=Sinosporangium siamense TaxID=1367973 RepID=A0A919V590_9ACTN|nr:hypothetical protein [Sinosporangium siamense]GII91308.1 hypothetical protein Ssi02_15390 [Sinosporangium siamense]